MLIANWFHVIGCLETLMLDVTRMTWCMVATSNTGSPSASQVIRNDYFKVANIIVEKFEFFIKTCVVDS